MKRITVFVLLVLLNLSALAYAQQVELSTSKDDYNDELEWAFHTEIDTVNHVDQGTIHYTLVHTKKGSVVSGIMREYTHIPQEAKDKFLAFDQKTNTDRSTYYSIAIYRFDRAVESLPNDSFSKQFPEDFNIWMNSQIAALVYYNGDGKIYIWLKESYKNDLLPFIKSTVLNTIK